MNNYIQCPRCKSWVDSSMQYCPRCGADLRYANPNPNPNPNPYPNGGGNFTPQFMANDAFAASPQGCSRGVAALLAIFIGALGIHYFYMGKSTAGIIFLLVSVLSCGYLATIAGLIALAQGIYMFTTDNITFYNKYVNTTESVPLF